MSLYNALHSEFSNKKRKDDLEVADRCGEKHIFSSYSPGAALQYFTILLDPYATKIKGKKSGKIFDYVIIQTWSVQSGLLRDLGKSSNRLRNYNIRESYAPRDGHQATDIHCIPRLCCLCYFSQSFLHYI